MYLNFQLRSLISQKNLTVSLYHQTDSHDHPTMLGFPYPKVLSWMNIHKSYYIPLSRLSLYSLQARESTYENILTMLPSRTLLHQSLIQYLKEAFGQNLTYDKVDHYFHQNKAILLVLVHWMYCKTHDWIEILNRFVWQDHNQRPYWPIKMKN